MRFFFLLLFLTAFQFNLFSKSPKKALLLSLCPGAGQVYNHAYWKVPVIYASFTVLGYYTMLNHQYFLEYRDEYVYRMQLSYNQANNTVPSSKPLVDPHPELKSYTLPDDLLTQKNYYEKNRNNLIVALLGVYVLNLVDAAVDAHLHTFETTDNLSLQFFPLVEPSTMNAYQASIGMKFTYLIK